MSIIREIIGPIVEGLRALVKPQRMSIDFPDELRAVPDNYRGVIEHHYSECTGCRVCCRVCPSGAVELQYELDGKYRPSIDYSRCVFCGLCVDSCPTSALRHVRYQEIVTENKCRLRFGPAQLTLSNLREVVVIRDERREVTYEVEGERVRKARSVKR